MTTKNNKNKTKTDLILKIWKFEKNNEIHKILQSFKISEHLAYLGNLEKLDFSLRPGPHRLRGVFGPLGTVCFFLSFETFGDFLKFCNLDFWDVWVFDVLFFRLRILTFQKCVCVLLTTLLLFEVIVVLFYCLGSFWSFFKSLFAEALESI